MTFDVNSKVSQIRGKDYLEVKWRIVWFRDEHPSGTIETGIANLDPLIMVATVKDESGRVLGIGHGSPKTGGVASARPFEGAETAAIGRALAHAGYGTQFTGEEEGEHLADSPVGKQNGNGNQPPPRKSAEQEVKELGYKWPDVWINEVLTNYQDIKAKKHAVNWLNLVEPASLESIAGDIFEYRQHRENMTAEEAASKVKENRK